jgi:hypothetical protein
VLFMPACIMYLYSLFLFLWFFFIFCHCNLYQQSRCLNNANPFFIQSRVQFFLPSHRNCLSPQRNSWELGDTKHKPGLFRWWSRS